MTPAEEIQSAVPMTILSDFGEVERRMTQKRDDLLELFLSQIEIEKTSRKTYRSIMTVFFKYIDERGWGLNGLDRQHLIEYANHLKDSGHSAFTINLYKAALKSFYKWTASQMLYPNIASSLKMEAFDRDNIFKEVLTPEESMRLLDYADTLSSRDRAIIYLVSYNGLRTIEITRLRMKDLTHDRNRHILKVHCKGARTMEKISVLCDAVYDALRGYIDEERSHALMEEPMFTKHHDGKVYAKRHKGTPAPVRKPLTARTVQSVIKESLRAIGLDGHAYSAHSLRHTVANDMLNNGASLFEIQETLHHTSVNTTRVYTKIAEREKRITEAPELIMNKVFKRNND